jgi:hypothetical protein
MPRFALASWLAVAALSASLAGFWGSIIRIPPPPPPPIISAISGS